MVKVDPKADKIVEDGWYSAIIQEKGMEDTKYGEKLVLEFDVTDGDGERIDIRAWLTLSDHPKSNVVKWGKALFGDRPFDTNEFNGLKCEVFLEESEGDDGEPKNFIRKVRKPKGASKQAKEATADQAGSNTEANFEKIPF